jgi:hypothetical protein
MRERSENLQTVELDLPKDLLAEIWSLVSQLRPLRLTGINGHALWNSMMNTRRIIRNGVIVLVTLLLGLLLATAVGVYWLGLLRIESHQGFFAPVWDRDGKVVYLLQRDTRGVIWGLGWEHFSPPAWSYVLSDRISLRQLDPESGQTEVLETFEGSPLLGRTTRQYHSRIFNFLSARIDPTENGVDFSLRMQVPRAPTSEQWALQGRWRPGAPSRARWSMKWAGSTAASDRVLAGGVELMTVRGHESFPAAVLAVDAAGAYRVLLKNGDFEELYPDGVPDRLIDERSNRERIERARELRRVREELVARYRGQGMNEGAAMLRARDEMEALGYFPKSPRLVASGVSEPPPGLRVFDIPEDRFRVGLFQDIAGAIATPGSEVKTSTGDYLKYDDDATGPDLEKWRNAGNDRFVIRTGGQLYLLEVRRFEQ